jgi:hypothetical protein
MPNVDCVQLLRSRVIDRPLDRICSAGSQFEDFERRKNMDKATFFILHSEETQLPKRWRRRLADNARGAIETLGAIKSQSLEGHP